MQLVCLVELRVSGNPLQKKWYQNNIVLFGNGWVNSHKGLGILRAQTGKHLHPRQDHFNLILLQNRDHLIQISKKNIWIDSAQSIVGPGFQNHDIRF